MHSLDTLADLDRALTNTKSMFGVKVLARIRIPGNQATRPNKRQGLELNRDFSCVAGTESWHLKRDEPRC